MSSFFRPAIRFEFSLYPSGVWYFNPLAWQLLFVLGVWLALGGANTLDFPVRSRLVLIVGVIYLLFALVMTLAAHLPELQNMVPRLLFEGFNPNDKTNLALYRVLHLGILVAIAARFIRRRQLGDRWSSAVSNLSRCFASEFTSPASDILSWKRSAMELLLNSSPESRPLHRDGGRLLSIVVEAD